MKTVVPVLVALAVGVGGIWGWNHFTLQSSMNDVLSDDERNEAVDVSVHYGSYVQPSVLVYDLQEPTGAVAPMDLFRVFLQFADKVQDKEFETVELAYEGEVRFKIDGSYFHVLGEEYGEQNPMYTIRTFPENLQKPDGSRAFGEWTGGMLGVTGKQMEDFKDFADQWME